MPTPPDLGRPRDMTFERRRFDAKQPLVESPVMGRAEHDAVPGIVAASFPVTAEVDARERTLKPVRGELRRSSLAQFAPDWRRALARRRQQYQQVRAPCNLRFGSVTIRLLVRTARMPALASPGVHRRRALPPWAPAAALAVVVVLLLLGCIFVFPSYLVDRDLGSTPPSRLTPDARLKATNEVRTTLLQGVAGAFFLATAFFTWRQIRISQRQLELSEDQQIAERFTRAVEQLGKRSLDIQLGGIFALESISRASGGYRDVIGQVLAAYVRHHAPWPPQQAPAPSSIAPDVQAALTVLGRTAGARRHDQQPINLCSADLRAADLRNAVLPGVQLIGSNLEKAHLEGAHLEEARLVDTRLRGAWLDGAHLQDAKLIHAKLEGTRLVETDLRGADLTSATVNGRSRLIKTKLEGAILRHVALGETRYGGLSWDEKTEWPDGFVLRDEITTQLPPTPPTTP
jgi:hypothetical protein